MQANIYLVIIALILIAILVYLIFFQLRSK